MITKTYLDGRLNQLEEKLKRGVEVKDERIFHEMEREIRILKDSVKSLEEKIEENRDRVNNYLREHNNVKIELEALKRKVDGIEKELNIEPSGNKNDIIISDF